MSAHRSKLVIVAVIVAFVLGLIFTITRSERSRDLVLSLDPVEGTDQVTVYVGGAVESPGLYSLARGARVSEALELAGRIDSADHSSLQLAAVLRDEETIMVPELAAEVPGGPVTDISAAPRDDLIDINTASAAELEALTGIGPVLAGRIIEWRESEGRFSSLDDLVEISGISENTVEDLRAEATVRP